MFYDIQVVLLGQNLNGNLRLGSLMKKSKDAIRRSFTFKNRFHKKAIKSLFRAKYSFEVQNISTTKKLRHGNAEHSKYENRNENDIVIGVYFDDTSFKERKIIRKIKVDINTIFVGVHVR